MDDQLDLFPIPVAVTALDPRTVAGAGTRVRGIWRVVLPRDPKPHLVYHDRYGWYCEEHGKACPAVPHARARGA